MTVAALLNPPAHREIAGFAWKSRADISVAPEVAAAEIQRIYHSMGAVTPSALLQGAAEEDSPLHPYFEWDDSEAAQRYRDTQARYLLRQLVVVYRKPDGEMALPTRYVVKLTANEGDPESDEIEHATQPNVYLPVNQVMESDVLRRNYVRGALAEAQQWRKRYADIHEFSRVFAAIDDLASEFGGQH